MKTIIIAGYPGIGKTTVSNKYQNVLDIDSYYFYNLYDKNQSLEKPKRINPKWPQNYIKEIKNQIKNYDIILIGIRPDALDLLEKENIEFIICYPDKESLNFYKTRYESCGYQTDTIDRNLNSYEYIVNKMQEYNKPKIILRNNETLENYLINNDYNLRQKQSILL